MQEDREMEQITGTVEHIVFHKEETGFTVLELACGDELITVVGELAGVGEGEELVCSGSYTSHPQFGDQFKAVMIERKLPTTTDAIYKYLYSGAVKGIGAATARRIMDVFGSESLEIIEKEPMRLTEVRGITAKKAMEIGNEFQRVFGIRTVMVYFGQLGLKTETAIAAWKKWGPLTADLISSDPYLLNDPDIGAAFSVCEDIRIHMGIPEDAPCRIRAGLMHVLRVNAGGNGHTCIPRNRLAEASGQLLKMPLEPVDDMIDELIESKRVECPEVNGRAYIYLPELYQAEQYAAQRMAVFRLLGSADPGSYEADIDHLETVRGIKYAGAQRRAIELALREPVLILTGGPGTGKTTTLNAIIELFRLRDMKVALAAPTGRAAKRMSELTGRSAQTIHRLLEVDFRTGQPMRFVHDDKNPLPYDAIVIDEMSMVDIQLFESLLRAVRLRAKLVLVGDSDQLPSVGPGSVLGDLIASGCFPTVELKEVFRQAAQSLIVTNAHRIIEGQSPELSVRTGDFFMLNSAYPEQTARTVCGLIAERLPRTYHYSPAWDIQVLCPTRQGEIGTTALNARLQDLLNPQDGLKRETVSHGVTYREGDKVMQTKNNYDIVWHRADEEGAGIFNGDIGMLERVDQKAGVFQVRFDDRLANYDQNTLAELEHAWAITVHKSQGSEFEAVIIPLQNWHQRLYYRKLLYTAVTRAKKLLILVGRPETVLRMVESDRKTIRYSNLAAFLRAETGADTEE